MENGIIEERKVDLGKVIRRLIEIVHSLTPKELEEPLKLPPELEAEWLELTAILCEIRERAGREGKKEEELLPWEREVREAEKEDGVSPVVSGAESIAANKGVFNEAGVAWRKRRKS